MHPFEGIKVVDLTHVFAGPFCTYQLALLGADVIKIEEPESGDYIRRRGLDSDLRRRLMGDHFLCQNANKRSLAVNLADVEGRRIVTRLASRADVDTPLAVRQGDRGTGRECKGVSWRQRAS